MSVWSSVSAIFDGFCGKLFRFSGFRLPVLEICSDFAANIVVFSEFAKKFPLLCYLKREEKEVGSQTYVIDKARLSIRLTAPYSEERRMAARKYAKGHGIHTNNCLQ